MQTAKYLWLDLETTGLDPQRDIILEASWVATDKLLNTVGVPIRGMVLAADPRRKWLANDFVRKMHTDNGLWNACSRSTYRASHLESSLAKYIEELEWELNGKPVLAGATVHFDRGFLRVHCPAVENLFHHRHLDVSSLKLSAVDVLDEPFAKAEAHRAQDDVLESLGQARAFYTWLSELREFRNEHPAPV